MIEILKSIGVGICIFVPFVLVVSTILAAMLLWPLVALPIFLGAGLLFFIWCIGHQWRHSS